MPLIANKFLKLATQRPALDGPGAAAAAATGFRFNVKNQYEFPVGVAPGFDASHMAVAPLRTFSAVVMGGSAFDVRSGKPGTRNGTPTATIDGAISQSFSMAGTESIFFTGKPTDNDARATMAAIFRCSAGGANRFILSNSVSQGLALKLNSSNQFQIGLNNVGDLSVSSALVTDAPYFIIGSIDQNIPQQNYVARRLDTGQVVTNTGTTAGTPTAPSGTYVIGNEFNIDGGLPSLSFIHCVMFTPKFMTVSELQRIAADPWSFWYPRNGHELQNERLI